MNTITELVRYLDQLYLNTLKHQGAQKQINAFDRLEAKIDVHDALSELNDIELDVVKMRYGIDYDSTKTFVQIGEYFGFSPTKAQSIHNKAIIKLRHVFATL